MGSDKVDIIGSAVSQVQCQLLNFLCGLRQTEIY